MIHPLFLAGRGSRADKRRAAIRRPSASAIVMSAQAEKALRRKQIADRLRHLQRASRKRVTLRSRIEQAGLSLTPAQFLAASVVAGLAAGLAVWARSGSPVLAALAAACASAGPPPFALTQLRRRRIARFVANFPNAIDIIARGTKSGMPLIDAIRVAAGESQKPIRDEFRKIVQATTVGLALAEAVERMAARVPVAEAHFFAIVIAGHGQAGGRVSEALGSLSRVLRERKTMRAKIGAMSMEAKVSAVMIGLAPFLVAGALCLSSPNYVSLLWTTSHGRLIAGIALAWTAIGVAVMKKMVSFDI